MSFSPNLVTAVLTDEYSGNVDLVGLPQIIASEASTALEMAEGEFTSIAITTNPNIITTTGTYNLSDEFFAIEEDGVMLTFFTPQVANYTGDPVLFGSYGGSITFTSYGTVIGDTVAGSFSINIEGIQTTGQEYNQETQEYDDVDVELTGAISGSFDMTIKENP